MSAKQSGIASKQAQRVAARMPYAKPVIKKGPRLESIAAYNKPSLG
jgi:hypothetical protein